MPTYDYQCQSCKTRFTVQASMKDPQPSCGPACTRGDCQIRKSLSRVFGQVTGAHAAPVEQAVRKAPEAPSHVCSKYCDQHK